MLDLITTTHAFSGHGSIDANNSGAHGSIGFDHTVDSGSKVTGNIGASTDYHGHNSYDGSAGISGSGWSGGINVTHGPNGNNYGGAVTWTW